MPPHLAHRDTDVKIAARLINATAEAIEDNIFLVADDAPRRPHDDEREHTPAPMPRG